MIRQVLEAMLKDCIANNRKKHTITYYRTQISYFADFCETQGVTEIEKVTSDLIRSYMISLQETHNQGGCHARYRPLRVLFLWYEREFEPEGWKNPIKKVRAPKVPDRPIDPITIEQIRALLATCESNFVGIRDSALLKFLLDTGARLEETTLVLRSDVDIYNGAVLIRHGKGGKTRLVYLGKKSLRSLRKYLQHRDDVSPSLWVTSAGHSLARSSIQGMLVRRAEMAGIPTRSAHKFRKAFSTIMSKAVDMFSLSQLTGDTLEVLNKHYVLRNDEAARGAYFRGGSPVDNLL